MHAPRLPALLIHPYMFTLLFHTIITAIVNVSVCVEGRESVGEIVRGNVYVCMCVCCMLSVWVLWGEEAATR